MINSIFVDGKFFTGAGIIVVNHNKKYNSPDILLVREARFGVYNDPGGTYDLTDYRLEVTATREAREETYNTINIDPILLKDYVDVPTGNGTYYRAYLYILRDKNFSCKQFYHNMHVYGYSQPGYGETDRLTRFPIRSILKLYKKTDTPYYLPGRDVGHKKIKHYFNTSAKPPRVRRVLREMIRVGLLNKYTGKY